MVSFRTHKFRITFKQNCLTYISIQCTYKPWVSLDFYILTYANFMNKTVFLKNHSLSGSFSK